MKLGSQLGSKTGMELVALLGESEGKPVGLLLGYSVRLVVGDVVGDFVVFESLDNSVGGSVGLMVANVGDDVSVPVGGNNPVKSAPSKIFQSSTRPVYLYNDRKDN